MFCPNCRNENKDDSKFCRFCGTPFILPQGETDAYFIQKSAPSKKSRFIPLFLGFLLGLYALSQLALSVTGVTSKGMVTGYEQRRYIGLVENSVDPTRYDMYYEFTAANGKQYTGSITKNFKNGIVASSEGTPNMVVVRYLPVMPHINTLEGHQSILFGILMFGASVLMFLLALHKKKVETKP